MFQSTPGYEAGRFAAAVTPCLQNAAKPGCANPVKIASAVDSCCKTSLSELLKISGLRSARKERGFRIEVDCAEGAVLFDAELVRLGEAVEA
mgnify:CR=1 FL=1